MPELMLSMVLWGTLGVFVLWSEVSAIEVAFYRCLIGALLVGCWLIRSKAKIKLDKNVGVVALAGICLVFNWVFLFKSFQVSSITIGNMSYYLQPIILIILGMFFYKEKVSLIRWVYISLALFGVLLTIDFHNLNSPHILLGVSFALFAALLYSFVTVLMKNINLSYDKVIFIQLFIGVLILLPFIHFQRLTVVAIVCLAVIGVVHTLFAYFLFVAIASDVLFFNKQLNLFQIAGVFLTFSALYLLVMASRGREMGEEVQVA